MEIVTESLNDFSRSLEQEDDISIVALKVKDPNAVTMTGTFPLPKATGPARGTPPPGSTPSAPSGPQGGVPPPGGVPPWMK